MEQIGREETRSENRKIPGRKKGYKKGGIFESRADPIFIFTRAGSECLQSSQDMIGSRQLIIRLR